jgi:outer membrane biosynthesis protein TonB
MKSARSPLAAWIAGAALALVGCAVRSPELYRDDTRKLLETKEPTLQACYDAELQTHRDAGGKVIVRFTVDRETGKVSNPQIDDLSSTPNRTLRGCVLDALKGLTLAPADDRDGDATFTWEFQIARNGM